MNRLLSSPGVSQQLAWTARHKTECGKNIGWSASQSECHLAARENDQLGATGLRCAL
jgi:hypothetical protein